MEDAVSDVANEAVADVIVRLASRLSDAAPGTIATLVHELLADLGRTLTVGRVYVFEHDAMGGTTSNTFEWCAPGIDPQIEALQQVPLAMIDHWQARFALGAAVTIDDVTALDPAAAPERETLVRQGVRALLAAPLRAQGRTTGFIGLDDLRGRRRWSQRLVGLLRAAAGIIGTALARTAAEEAHRDLNAQLEAIAGQVPGTLFRFVRESDGSRRFTYVGPRFAEMLGMDPAPLGDDATAALERIHADDVARFAQTLEHSRMNLSRWEHTFRVVDADGRTRHLLGRADPHARGDGRVVWNGLLLDVSDLWGANEALTRSAANLRSILETSDDAVILIDGERRVLDVNRSARERAERVLGRSLGVGDVVTDVIRDRDFARDLDEAFAGRTLMHERPVVPERSDVAPYWAEVQAHPVTDASGAVQAVVYRSADVTDRKRASDAIARGTAFRQGLLTLVQDMLARELGDDLYHHVLAHAVANVPGAEAGSVVVLRADGRYHYVAAVGFALDELRTISFAPEELVQTNSAGATVLRPSYDNRHHTVEVRGVLETAGRVEGIQATLVAPVDVAGERLGYLHLDSFSDTTAFDDGSVELASLLAGTVGMALQRLRLEARLKQERSKLAHLASHDVLTDLPNRVVLADRLDQALARAQRRDTLTGLLFLDLDGFKAVNDRFGHLIGDDVLRDVARRLRAAVRAEDTVARLGGDEFAIIAADLHRSEDALTVARKALAALAEPFEFDTASILLGGSIGISLAPVDASNAGAMMQNADLALYRVKQEGRGGVAFFTTDLDERMRDHAALTADLRLALTRHDQLGVVYQPIVRLDDRAIVGMEALARWRHPTRGEVRPATFVPLAEQAGFIGPLGRVVLERTCHDLAAWRAAGIGRTWRCAVNVSAVQVRSEGFAEELQGLVEACRLSLADLEIEVTESTIMDHSGPALANLATLRAAGARVVIDDFGTGFSSLSRLRDLPVDAVKVDRSFVAALARSDGARDAAIIDAIVALADGLGLETVAEGIETEAQRSRVLAHGCRLGQGYLFAQPSAADAILRRHRH